MTEQFARILCVIPARAGSKGVPGKNIRPLAGRPLIAFAIAAAREAGCFVRVMVSTDGPEIAKAAEQEGADVPFLRPAELSGDKADLFDVCRHALNHYEDKGEAFDGVMSLQPTAPFITPDTLRQAARLFTETEPDCVTSVAEITQGHPYISKRLLDRNRIEDFCIIPEGAVVSPRQAREKAYFLTGAFYLRNSHYLKHLEYHGGHALGDDPAAVIVSDREAWDINSSLDFEIAEFFVKKEGL